MPDKKERVIDCLKQAGIKIPKNKNRYFLSLPAFNQPKIVVLNFWYEKQIIQQGEDIIINWPLLKYSHRMRKVQEAIKSAIEEKKTIRVLVLYGKPAKKGSKVLKRALDPVPWSVKSYSEKTGMCVLLRDVHSGNGSRINNKITIDPLDDNKKDPAKTFLFVTKPKYHPELIKDGEILTWSCSSETCENDRAFVYVTGKGICYEWRAVSDAQPTQRGPWPFTCDVEFVSDFDPPITTQVLCNAIPQKEWNAPHANMRVKASIIPPKALKTINSLRGMIRLPILHDRLQRNAFDLLRTWRQSHPSGLLLCVNGKKAFWHNASCKHIGDPNVNQAQWEMSLTKRRKVLGGTIEDLAKWASENGLNARSCSDCMKEPYTVASLADGFKLLDEAKSVATEEEFQDGPSPRVTTTVQRIVRDTELAKTVKQNHRYHCQICGERIALPDGRFYAEAHHIRPLGSPHNGPDNTNNILCLCPNHHVALDYGCVPIDISKLRKNEGHQISDEHTGYHNRQIFIGQVAV